MTGQAIPARNAPASGTAPECAAVKVWWFDSSQPGPTEIESLAQVPAAHRVAAFFACWMRKEALLKAHGTGLTRAPAEVGLGEYDPQKTFQPDVGPVSWAMTALKQGTGSKLSLHRWRLPADYVAPKAPA
jgi:phosphopantetheinyl transferase